MAVLFRGSSFLVFIFIGTLQNHARKYNLPIDELSFKYNMIPIYRDQAAVTEAAKTVQFGQELPMDLEVQSPDYCYSKAALSQGHLRSQPSFPSPLSHCLPHAGAQEADKIHSPQTNSPSKQCLDGTAQISLICRDVL